MLPILIVAGAVALIAAWAVWAARRDAAAEAAARGPVPPKAAPAKGAVSENQDPFAPPAEPDAPSQPELWVFSPLVTAGPAFVLGPLYGGSVAAWNWYRTGNYRRAAGMLAAGVGIHVGSEVIVVLLGGSGLDGLVLLARNVVIVLALFWDQYALADRFPRARTTHWVYMAFFGFAIICCGVNLRDCIRGEIWVVTGDERYRPESMGGRIQP